MVDAKWAPDMSFDALQALDNLERALLTARASLGRAHRACEAIARNTEDFSVHTREAAMREGGMLAELLEEVRDIHHGPLGNVLVGTAPTRGGTDRIYGLPKAAEEEFTG